MRASENSGLELRVAADEDRCCGSGNCALTVPEVFDQRDTDGVVIVLDPRPPASRHDSVRAAVAGCPTGAISVTRPAGQHQS